MNNKNQTRDTITFRTNLKQDLEKLAKEDHRNLTSFLNYNLKKLVESSKAKEVEA